MRCEAAERELSARQDAAGDDRLDEELTSHLATCHRCRSFRDASARIREVARVRPADPVPDLVPGIMAEVGRGAVNLRRRREWGRAVAAFAAGVVAVAVVAGGLPGVRRGPSPALATEIPLGIARASTEVTSYRASFRVVEHGFRRSIPRRTFLVELAFRAPERFRVQVHDRTSYPGDAWPRNDMVLAIDGDRWRLDAPRGCPREALPACAPAGRDIRVLRGRPPFDAESALPTDVILPVRSLAGTPRVRVVGETEVLDRAAVVIELEHRDAASLFDSFQPAGVWRPFFPQDRVLLTLDAESWFPLAVEVRAAAGPERGLWAVRNGLAAEPAGRLLYRAEARSLGPGPPPAWRPFTAGDGARDLGFEEEPFGPVADRIPAPTRVGTLRPYRAGVVGGETILAYADGLSWLRVRTTRGWAGAGPFGGFDSLAERVRLASGVASWEPATGSLGRRVAIHAEGWDLVLESNLPRAELLDVAASIPVRGVAVPEPGRVTVAEALDAAPFAMYPADLPLGYGPTAATVEDGGVTFLFRRDGAELDGGGIRLFQSAAADLPPPMDPDVLAVRVRGLDGRYAPARGELEWVEDGVYRSLGGGALDLAGLLRVARSMRPM
jgi:hypothetical protein